MKWFRPWEDVGESLELTTNPFVYLNLAKDLERKGGNEVDLPGSLQKLGMHSSIMFGASMNGNTHEWHTNESSNVRPLAMLKPPSNMELSITHIFHYMKPTVHPRASL
ncbi:Uncharacterized protein TCM_039451 [Theobroma cacao]|uniref:Uncharacterized protein n=1 Tax=Theobroma cacao TaxID=3641 RepID=A0A061GR94_THECC|nr:Uncharacterized protein TCM_039451 [Theobroma cacao]